MQLQRGWRSFRRTTSVCQTTLCAGSGGLWVRLGSGSVVVGCVLGACIAEGGQGVPCQCAPFRAPRRAALVTVGLFFGGEACLPPPSSRQQVESGCSGQRAAVFRAASVRLESTCKQRATRGCRLHCAAGRGTCGVVAFAVRRSSSCMHATASSQHSKQPWFGCSSFDLIVSRSSVA